MSSLWTCISGSQSALPALPFPHSMSTSPLYIDLAAAWCYPLASSTSTSHCLTAHSDWWSLSSCIYSQPSSSRIFPLLPSSSPLILLRVVRISSSKQTVSGVPVLNIVYIHFLPISSILTYRSSYATWYRSLSLSYSSLIYACVAELPPPNRLHDEYPWLAFDEFYCS